MIPKDLQRNEKKNDEFKINIHKSVRSTGWKRQRIEIQYRKREWEHNVCRIEMVGGFHSLVRDNGEPERHC